ncbi:MAG TPA: T9SS type B sorting domain-containing protein, partial [Flavobacteriales bacterium]|nr:T9SS type B sorting domain-containing protein [Flavobacteriales bacterium]
NDGLATVSITGGTAPFIYSWNDPLSQVTPTAGNLTAGIYTVSATDSNGCIASTSVTINEPPAIIYNPASSTPSCFGDCDGTVGVTVSGGISPYIYQWNDPSSQTNATAVGLCAGTYTVVITDSNNCTEIAVVSIVDPSPITSMVSSTDESCFGACDGSVTVTPSNGLTPYTYLWDDPFGQATQTAGNICVGTYTVIITDNNGCTASNSVTVNGPADLSISISSSGNNPCAGDCIGFAQTFVSGGTAPYTYNWTDGQTNPQAINLCAGSFNVTVTDANACSTITSVNITEPLGMVVNITGNNISCNGACDGDATASVGGGTPPYAYLWNDPLFQTTSIANNLCGGFFNVTVTDLNGCSETTSIVLTEPQSLGLSSTTNSSTCGFNNGSACVNPIGGIAPYVITWNDPMTTVGACVFNILAGTYNPIVVDGNGCSFTVPVVINDISGPTIDSISNTNVTCAGDSNGTASVFITGVAPPYTYIWKDNNGNTVDSNLTTIFGLWGGTYTITVIDANGCTSGALIAINEPPQLNSVIISSSPASCNGVCDGLASVMVGGGVSPYTYLWTDGQTSTTAINLCAGSHNIFITDNNGCTDLNTISITEPDAIAIDDSIIDVSCNGGADGQIYLNVTGGTPFYSYSWLPSGTSSANIATNLIAQTYNVTVTDINGCNENATLLVNDPAALVASHVSVSSSCDLNNGSAIVTVSGGAQPYTYLWDDPNNTTNDTVIDLFARDPYYVSITDANGCTIVHSVIVNNAPGAIIDSLDITNITCNGYDDGSVNVIYSGGTAPLTFAWDDALGQTTTTAVGLEPGAIGVTITDANGCQTTGYGVIIEPPPLVITTSLDTTICAGESTIIWAVATGGTLPYSLYGWNNGLNGDPTHIVTPDTTTIYNVWILDINNCPTQPASITVTVNPLITLNAPDIDVCEGEDAVITVSASGGNGGPYNYVWNTGFIGSTLIISGLNSEDDTSFTVTVSDNCSPDTTVVVNVTVHPGPGVLFTSEGGGCEPYVFIAYSSNPDTVPIVNWLWDFGDGTTSTEAYTTTHEYSVGGVYDVTLYVTSDKGCLDSITDLGAAIVFALPTANFTIVQNGSVLNPPVTSLFSPVIDFINTSSNNVDSVIWDFGDPSTGINNTSNLYYPSHEFSDTGTYTITLTTYTPEGCWDIVSHEVTIEGVYILFAPNAFTPNDDGDNEYFMPRGMGVEGDQFELYIYDRWGDLIAEVTGNFSNDPTIGWDGRANKGQHQAQIDVYVWLIKTEDVNGVRHEYVGHVSLIR